MSNLPFVLKHGIYVCQVEPDGSTTFPENTPTEVIEKYNYYCELEDFDLLGEIRFVRFIFELNHSVDFALCFMNHSKEIRSKISDKLKQISDFWQADLYSYC